MNRLPISARLKPPFLIAGLQSFRYSVGAVVFLVAVYRTVVVGGKLLTGRRLDEQLELMPETSPPQSADAGIDRARPLVRSEF